MKTEPNVEIGLVGRAVIWRDCAQTIFQVLGRAIALYDMGEQISAIAQAKKMIFLNPSNGQGIRFFLSTWFFEAHDAKSCTNLLRKYGTDGDKHLAYTDVLLQFLHWKKDDAVGNNVWKVLYMVLKANPYVPDIIKI